MPNAFRDLLSRTLFLACVAAPVAAQEPTFTHADTLRGTVTPERESAMPIITTNATIAPARRRGPRRSVRSADAPRWSGRDGKSPPHWGHRVATFNAFPPQCGHST